MQIGQQIEKKDDFLIFDYYNNNNGTDTFRRAIKLYFKIIINNTLYRNIYYYLMNVQCCEFVNDMLEIINMTSSISADDKMIFQWALICKNYHLMKTLINKGININEPLDGDNNYPLYMAITSKDISLCEWVIDVGAIPLPYILTNIFSQNISLDIFKYMICVSDIHNIDIIQICSTNADAVMRSLLFEIYYDYFQNHQFEKIKILVDRGYKLNIFSPNKTIRKFVSKCQIDKIIYLIDNGLKMDNKILYNAIIEKNVQLISLAIDHGFSFDHKICKLILDRYISDEIILMLQYDCDLSYIISEFVKYHDVVEKFNKYGIDNNILINYLFTLPGDDIYFDFSHFLSTMDHLFIDKSK